MTVNGKIPTLPDGAEPLHSDPRWVVTILHDGQVQVAGCAWCADPGLFAATLRATADTIEAQA